MGKRTHFIRQWGMQAEDGGKGKGWGKVLPWGAWQAAVHGVAQSWTRLNDFTFTFHFHALGKEMATHSSVLAWKIPETGEPGGLPSMGSHRVRHDWSDLAAAAATQMKSLRERQVFIRIKPWYPQCCTFCNQKTHYIHNQSQYILLTIWHTLKYAQIHSVWNPQQ